MAKQLSQLVVIVCVVTTLALPAWGNVQETRQQNIIGIGETIGHGIGRVVSFLTGLEIAKPVLVTVVQLQYTSPITAMRLVLAAHLAKSVPHPIGRLVGVAALVAFAPTLGKYAGREFIRGFVNHVAPSEPPATLPVWKN